MSAFIASFYIVVGTFDSLVTFLGMIAISASESSIMAVNVLQAFQNTFSSYLLSLGFSYSVVGKRLLRNGAELGPSILSSSASSVLY